jgi:hypothetical protein
MAVLSSIGLSCDDALRYATFARAAYSDLPALKQAFGDAMTRVDLPGSQIQVLLIRDISAGIQWIAVRGTANLRNALTDGRMKIVHEPKLGAYIHGGFLRASHEACDAILQKLDPGMRIRVTGHSLGGAVAVILTMLIAESGFQRRLDRTITFGQPMVTDRNGVKVLENYQCLRVVNHRDPVAVLPLILSRTHFELRPTLFYHHAGMQLTLFADKAPTISAPTRFSNLAFGFERFLANHLIDLYVDRLQTLIR